MPFRQNRRSAPLGRTLVTGRSQRTLSGHGRPTGILPRAGEAARRSQESPGGPWPGGGVYDSRVRGSASEEMPARRAATMRSADSSVVMPAAAAIFSTRAVVSPIRAIE